MTSSFPIVKLEPSAFPPLLHEIPQVPKELYARGILPPTDLKLLAVVGSRAYTSYGKQAVSHLIEGLRGYPVGIVSGLALGIDSLAHEAALKHGLYTLAIPGSGVDDSAIYPASHRPLARSILEHNGGILSEFEPTFRATKWSFTERNRIMAGIAHATLVIEAQERSGTLITARMTADYNRELMVVPGSIFSKNSAGVHQFLKLGATPVTCAEDIILALGMELIETSDNKQTSLLAALSAEEQKVLQSLHEPLHKDLLMRSLALDTARANVLLMQMELTGIIASENNVYRAVI